MSSAVKAFLSLFLVIFSSFGYAGEQQAILCLKPEQPQNIEYPEIYEDKDLNLSFEEILRRDEAGQIKWTKEKRLNRGFVSYKIWFKFGVRNGSDVTSWILEQPFPLTQYVHVYFKDDLGEVKHLWAGRARPFNERPIIHKNLLFPFTLNKGKGLAIYMSYQSVGPIIAAPVVTADRAFITKSENESLLYGLYLGLLFGMFLYNLSLYFGTRDVIYIFYSLYIMTFLIFNMCVSGLAYQYLWPSHQKWNDISTFVLSPIYYFFLSIFTKIFLQTRRYSVVGNWLVNFIIFVFAVLSLVPFIFFNGYVCRIIAAQGTFFAPVVLFGVCILSKSGGAKNVRYFLVSFAAVIIANAVYGARTMGIISDNFLTNHGIQIASTAEVFLFSMALVDRIKCLQEEEERQKSIIELVSSFCHNMKSPIATLIAVLPLVKVSDRAVSAVIRHAVDGLSRQMSILLDQRRRALERFQNFPISEFGLEFLPGLIEQTVHSKAVELRKYDLIDISFPENDLFIFVKVNNMDFRSVLSNLLDNANEAIRDGGGIKVSLVSIDNGIMISIADNGIGIASERVRKILEGAYVSDKPNGNGIGIKHAQKCIEEWGGTFHMESKPNSGTVVEVWLPREPVPSWFATSIRIRRHSVIIVLDDESSIHKLWDQRIFSICKEGEVVIEHLFDGTLLEDRVEESSIGFDLAFVDHELLNQSKSGLQLIRELGIASRSVLVTSHWDDPKVVQQCEEINLKILPKLFAGRVPIAMTDSPVQADDSNIRCVLIDDNEGIRALWEVSARNHGVRIRTFDSKEAFLEVKNCFPKGMEIYIDFYLEHGVLGKDVSLDLYNLGFSKVFVVTGESEEYLPPMPWVSGILGKEPFWLSSINSERKKEYERWE